MSFSHTVKEELSGVYGATTKARRRELQAFSAMLGEEEGRRLVFTTENILVAKKIIRLLGEFFPRQYAFKVQYRGRFRKIYYLITLYDHEPAFFQPGIIEKKKEKGAYLRGAFLARGSLTDPRKAYHLELRCPSFQSYLYLGELLESFGVEAKGITRKNVFFLYLKSAEMISDFLKIIGAFHDMFAFEEARVIKDMKNKANRLNNCDLANLDKTLKASAKQVRIIRELGLAAIPQKLREVAALRLEYPELSLSELGEKCLPPLKRSAVNYRLKRIEALGGKEE